MTDGIIDLNGQPLTPEQASVENTKNSILIIEKFFMAINSLQFGPPLRLAQNMIAGMEFLNQMHQRLVAELGPEEIEKMREQYQPAAPKPTHDA